MLISPLFGAGYNGWSVKSKPLSQEHSYYWRLYADLGTMYINGDGSRDEVDLYASNEFYGGNMEGRGGVCLELWGHHTN
jgi:hypothetical protein